MGNKKFLALLVLLVALLFATPAFADIFGPRSTDIFDIGSQGKLSSAGEDTAKLSIDADTLIGSIGNIVAYLGSREGFAYDFKQKEIVNQLGATLYTKYNIALDLILINVDGAALGIDYNVGAILPVGETPILKYLKYLYVGGSYGARYIDDEWEQAPMVDVQIKFTF